MDEKKSVSEKLEQAEKEYLEKLKRVKLIEAGVSLSDSEVYVKYITAERPSDIESEVNDLVADIALQNTAAVNQVRQSKRAWNVFGE